jgi:hypothetical protein
MKWSGAKVSSSKEPTHQNKNCKTGQANDPSNGPEQPVCPTIAPASRARQKGKPESLFALVHCRRLLVSESSTFLLVSLPGIQMINTRTHVFQNGDQPSKLA